MDLINVREAFGGKYICRTVNDTIGKVEQQFTLLVGGKGLQNTIPWFYLYYWVSPDVMAAMLEYS